MPDKTVEVYPFSPQGIQIDKEHSKQAIKDIFWHTYQIFHQRK
jgi:hypothetical protein